MIDPEIFLQLLDKAEDGTWFPQTEKQETQTGR